MRLHHLIVSTMRRASWLTCLSVLVLGACADNGADPIPRENAPPPTLTIAASTNPSANLDQCANGPLNAPVPCSTPTAWVNGNLNENQAHYVEGDLVPYRLRFGALATGAAYHHTVRLEWDSVVAQSSTLYHALDYLGGVNTTEATANACAGVSSCVTTSGVSTYAVPVDAYVAKGPDGIAGTADDITMRPGVFTLYGGTITSVTGYTIAGSTSKSTALTLTFTASRANPVLAWGGHIAVRTDWAPQLAAARISGSPYHMRLGDFDGNCGSQDRSLSASAVHLPPELMVIKNVVNDSGGTAVAGDFMLLVHGVQAIPEAFAGQGSPGTRVRLAPGAYSVGEVAMGGYLATYSAGCSGTVAYDQTVTCTVTNNDPERCVGVVCPAPASECLQAGVCNVTTGTCDYAPKAAGTACTDDSNVCTRDVCGAEGTCTHPAGHSGVTCRAAAGVCDVAEACNGTSAACPSDLKSHAECRGSAGICDVAERCDGVSNVCPNDAFAPSTNTCRTADGVCDVAERCTGQAAACPANAFAPQTTTCRVAAGICDVAETCTGMSALCPNDSFRSAATECRAAAGECDVGENCTGFGAACPPDVLLVGVVCREEAGACDVAEACDGVSAACPTDVFDPGLPCRPAAGVCDAVETCNGRQGECPNDQYLVGVTCRAKAGACDVPEVCEGLGPDCLPDRFDRSGTVCRAATSACDPAEVCPGNDRTCPADVADTCTLCGSAFYDANVDRVFGSEEEVLAGWQVELGEGAGTATALTDSDGVFVFTDLAAGDYTLCQDIPYPYNWAATTPRDACVAVHVPSADGEACLADFGNVCLGTGGAREPGYWTSRTGAFAFAGRDRGARALTMLRALPLRDARGGHFEPTSYYAVERWLTLRTTTNMAYALSAEVAASELAIFVGDLDASAIVYAPSGAGEGGFTTLQAVLTAAETAIYRDGYTPIGSPARTDQALLQALLERLNDNHDFVKPDACTFTYHDPNAPDVDDGLD